MAIFGARRRVEDLELELARMQATPAEFGALDHLHRAARRRDAEQRLNAVLAEEHAARTRVVQVEREVAQVRTPEQAHELRRYATPQLIRSDCT